MSEKWMELRFHLQLLVRWVTGKGDEFSIEPKMLGDDLSDTSLVEACENVLSSLKLTTGMAEDERQRISQRIRDYCLVEKEFRHGEPLMPEHLNALLLRTAFVQYLAAPSQKDQAQLRP